jgi:hypothetical protein
VPKTEASVCKSRKNSSKHCSGCHKGERVGGGESHSELEPSEVDEDEEGEIIFARSPLHEYLPSPGDLFGRRLGAPASAHRAECPS